MARPSQCAPQSKLLPRAASCAFAVSCVPEPAQTLLLERLGLTLSERLRAAETATM